MDETIKQFLDSYKTMIATYESKVPKDDPSMQELMKCYREGVSYGESFADYFAFNDKLTYVKWNERFNELISKVAMVGLNSSPSQKFTSADVAAGYHHAYNALPEKGKEIEKNIYERMFAIEKEFTSAPGFLAKVAEEKLWIRLAKEPMLAMYKHALAETIKINVLPTMEIFNEQAMAVSEKARNVPEIEYETNRLALLANLETTWDQLALNTVYFLVGNSISSWDLSQSEENREKVENSARFLGEYFSISVKDMLALPRIKTYIESMLVPGIKKNRPEYSYDVYVKEVLASLEKCVKDKPPVQISSGKDFLEYYGTKISLKEWHIALKNPPRPKEISA